MADRPALIVFARAPIAGRAKTRLIPALGPEGAADLYRCFLLDTLEMSARAPADLIVAAADPDHLPLLQAIAAEAAPGAELIAQQGRDLGERMLQAADLILSRGHPSAVIIGTDSPSLPLARVCEALALSSQRDLVLGPCLDGGYYLIGMRAALPALFRDIPWGSDSVLLETVRRARRHDASVSLLDPWYDVDTPADLVVLRRHLAAQSLAGELISCPRTWERLRLSAGPEE